jgi:hypothetical protein
MPGRRRTGTGGVVSLQPNYYKQCAAGVWGIAACTGQPSKKPIQIPSSAHLERRHTRATGRIPQTCSPVKTATGQMLAVRASGYAQDPA